jgi:hypothetical protein
VSARENFQETGAIFNSDVVESFIKMIDDELAKPNLQ